MEEKNEEEKKSVPSWIGPLLRRKFFTQCAEHRELSNSDLRMYCIECQASLCSHCLLSPSADHHLLQIRRYIYNDVIHAHDMKKFIDCSKIQRFVVNGQKVIFLNPKEREEKSVKRSRTSHPCLICDGTLPEPNRYCSISCKLQHNTKLVEPIEAKKCVAAPKKGAKRRKDIPRRSPFF